MAMWDDVDFLPSSDPPSMTDYLFGLSDPCEINQRGFGDRLRSARWQPITGDEQPSPNPGWPGISRVEEGRLAPSDRAPPVRAVDGDVDLPGSAGSVVDGELIAAYCRDCHAAMNGNDQAPESTRSGESVEDR